MLKKASLLFIGVVASGLAWADTDTVKLEALGDYSPFDLNYSAYIPGKGFVSPSGKVSAPNVNQLCSISKIPNGALLAFWGAHTIGGNGCSYADIYALGGDVLAVPAGATVGIYTDDLGDPYLQCLPKTSLGKATKLKIAMLPKTVKAEDVAKQRELAKEDDSRRLRDLEIQEKEREDQR